MSSRFAELGHHYLERKMSINFHDGFRDLNPQYHSMRRQRVLKVANNWLEKIKESLKARVAEEALKNFNEWVAKGNKLTYKQLN